MKRGAADAHRRCRRRDVAAGARQGLQDDAPFGGLEILFGIDHLALQPRQRDRPGEVFLVEAESPPRLAGGADHEVVLIDGDQCGELVARRTRAGFGIRAGEDDPAIGKHGAKIQRLDPAGRIHDGAGDQAGEPGGQVGPAGGDVDDRQQIALMIEDRGCGAGQVDILGLKMLVLVDGQPSLFDEAGSDAVGAFALFAPHRPGPEAPFIEGPVVLNGAAPGDDHAVGIGQQHRAADVADSPVQAVEAGIGGVQQQPGAFVDFREFLRGQPFRRLCMIRIDPVQHFRALPGGDHRKLGRFP